MEQNQKAASIFLADDNPDNLSVLTEILEQADYATRASLSGIDMLSSIKIEKPELVILDVHMPEMDGYEVCRALKSSAETREIPVIFCSALDEEFNVVRAFDSGGVDYITKPFRPKEVLARVRTHLTLKARESELQESLAQLKAVQAHLVQTEKMKSLGVLMAGIAHNANNPLNYIISSLDGLEKGLKDIRGMLDKQRERGTLRDELDEIQYPALSVEMDELLAGARDGARDVHYLVRSLRRFTQTGTTDAIADATAASVPENLECVLSLVRAALPDACRIDVDVPDLPTVRISANDLSQVLLSILSNCIDAIRARDAATTETGTAGLISISAERSAKLNGIERPVVAVTVNDNGIGMDAHTLSHATDPFFSTKDPSQAVGLGLTSCSRMIRDARGSLELDSTPGVGTSVTIVLPAADRVAEA
ncbi:MAG: response regulator [Spirochaetaceae bacterium]|nr:MAG: response regulator [Spirochaetaceae bacterium]